MPSKDMLKKKCKKCKKGRYYEWSFYCDRGDEPLKCSECGHKTPRWIEKKKKKKKKKLKGVSMTEQEIKQQIEHAKAVVSSWPVWKQNILVDSSVSCRRTARTPVDTKDDW